MSVLPIICYPDPILRQVASPVVSYGQPMLALIRDMFDSMRQAKGVGLAAPQVGVSLRVIVVSYQQHQLALVNPVLTHLEGEESGEEGCLSLPNVSLIVPRATIISVEAQSPNGHPIRLKKLKGYLARIIQHEVDHLNGVLILDKGGELNGSV